MLKYHYIFQIKYTEAILSNSSRKLLWFEINKMLIAVKNKFIVLFIIISAHFRYLFQLCHSLGPFYIVCRPIVTLWWWGVLHVGLSSVDG